MSILVTGGLGYVGSHCVQWLCEQGLHPVVIDVAQRSAPTWPTAVTVYPADIGNTALVQEILQDHSIHTVFHLAGVALVGQSMADPGLYYQHNVVGTASVLQAMRQAHVKRLVFSSSCTVYGEVPDKTLLDEHHPLAPISPYGRSKQMAEQMIADFQAAYGLQAVIFRYFNAAGAHALGHLHEQHEPETHLIPLALQAARDATPFTITGNGVRDYVHVCDIAQAHGQAMQFLSMQSSHSVPEILNLGLGHGYSVQEVLAQVQQVTQRPLHSVEGSTRLGDPPYLVATPQAARDVLGWQPQYSSLAPILESAWRVMQ